MGTKVIAVSVHCNGKTHTIFPRVEIGEDGKARVSQEAIRQCLKALGVHRGECYSVR